MAKRKVTPEENRALPSTHPDFDPWQYSRDVERLGLVGRLGAGPYATLRTIAGHVNDKVGNRRYGKAWLGEDTLAAEVGLSERQVREHIKKLVKHGLIAVHKEKGRTGNRNEYELLPINGWCDLAPPAKPANLAQLHVLNRRRAAGLKNGDSPPVYKGGKNGDSPPPKTATARRFKTATARRLKRRQPAAEVPSVSPQRKCTVEVPPPEGGRSANEVRSAPWVGVPPNGHQPKDAVGVHTEPALRVPAVKANGRSATPSVHGQGPQGHVQPATAAPPDADAPEPGTIPALWEQMLVAETEADWRAVLEACAAARADGRVNAEEYQELLVDAVRAGAPTALASAPTEPPRSLRLVDPSSAVAEAPPSGSPPCPAPDGSPTVAGGHDVHEGLTVQAQAVQTEPAPPTSPPLWPARIPAPPVRRLPLERNGLDAGTSQAVQDFWASLGLAPTAEQPPVADPVPEPTPSGSGSTESVA